MAVVLTLEFNYEINSSLQIGDNIYHATPTSSGNYSVVENISSITHVGTVYDIISSYKIEVYSDYIDSNTGNLLSGIQPPSNSYISFSKNKAVNNSDLLGYYGEVNFENDSKLKAELFSVGSEVSENSK